MKKILENWRNYTSLHESKVKNPKIQEMIDSLAKLPPFLKIKISTDEKEFIQVQYYIPKEESDKITQRDLEKTPEHIEHDRIMGRNDASRVRKMKVGDLYPVGAVEALKSTPKHDGPCYDSWLVVGASASHGWGPLLYEVAIEIASRKHGGLMPDRGSVSQYAIAVWEKYNSRQDIEKKQADLFIPPMRKYQTKPQYDPKLYKQLTPDYEFDDCDQTSAVGNYETKWDKSPLSKVYRKNNTETIDALMAIDRLIWTE